MSKYWTKLTYDILFYWFMLIHHNKEQLLELGLVDHNQHLTCLFFFYFKFFHNFSFYYFCKNKNYYCIKMILNSVLHWYILINYYEKHSWSLKRLVKVKIHIWLFYDEIFDIVLSIFILPDKRVGFVQRCLNIMSLLTDSYSMI